METTLKLSAGWQLNTNDITASVDSASQLPSASGQIHPPLESTVTTNGDHGSSCKGCFANVSLSAVENNCRGEYVELSTLLPTKSMSEPSAKTSKFGEEGGELVLTPATGSHKHLQSVVM